MTGGSHSHNPWEMAETMADDRDSWGKRTTQLPGSAMHEESPNSRVEWQLIDGAGAAAAYLSVGKSWENGRKLWLAEHFYTPEERERCVVPYVDDRTPASSRSGGARRTSGFPCSESVTGGPQWIFER
jgi:hypothetical protein